MKANFQPRVETFCGPRLPDVWVDDDGSHCSVELLSAIIHYCYAFGCNPLANASRKN